MEEFKQADFDKTFLKLAPAPPAALPRLSIAQADKKVLLTWPTSPVGYLLESSADLRTWKAAPAPSVAGDQNTLAPEPGSQFFRLRKP